MKHDDCRQDPIPGLEHLQAYERSGASGHSLGACNARVIEHLLECNFCLAIYKELVRAYT